MKPMRSEWLIPNLATLLATIAFATVAGLGEFSAAAIYAGMAAMAVLWVGLAAWSDPARRR